LIITDVTIVWVHIHSNLGQKQGENLPIIYKSMNLYRTAGNCYEDRRYSAAEEESKVDARTVQTPGTGLMVDSSDA